MTYQIKLDEAKIRRLDLIEAAIKGEEVFILGDDQLAVKLVPVKPPKRQAQFGSARGLVIMLDDFDEPLEDFNK